MNISEMLSEYMSESGRPSWDEYFLTISVIAASRSTCSRRRVGCVLVDSTRRIIGTGYNGVARGLDHCTLSNPCPGALLPSGSGLDACEAIHAEANALINCIDHLIIDTAYCTTAPCIHCTKLLMNTPCRRIVFADPYPNNGEYLWKKKQRHWVHFPLS